MLQALTQTRMGRGEETKLRRQLEDLRAENARLRAENRDLRMARDAYIARAASAAAFGPLELTAGTCVGPRRRRRQPPRHGRDA